MSFFSRKKKHSEAPASGLASSQVTQKRSSFPPIRNRNRNHLRKNNSRSLSTHGLHMLPHSDSRHHHFFDVLMRFPRLPLNCSSFGGKSQDRTRNDLYVISTRDFSSKLLQTCGDVPSPRCGHRAVLTSTILLIWGGDTDSSNQKALNQNSDDSFYLLNLGM
jgi:hypothetical protein